MKYFSRYAEIKLKEYIKQFPVVAVTGPRQCGKSTLLTHFAPNWHYVTFDQRGVLSRARQDPGLFVQNLPNHSILDEAQKAPEIFSAIKYRVDKNPQERFILSGSASFQLLASITESLAGRVGLIELYPFSVGESEGFPLGSFLQAWLKNQSKTGFRSKKIRPLKTTMQDLLLFGGYPKLIEFKQPQAKFNWLENYRTTYIERDVRDLAQVARLDEFQRLYPMIAYQTGNLINYSKMASDLGVALPTCKQYLSLLEASYQVFHLRPYFRSLRKRLIKTPKIYFSDVGMANFLRGNFSYEALELGGAVGAVFETFVITEIMKVLAYLSPKPQYYFFRSQNGAEVDLMIEWGGKILPIEIKYATQIDLRELRGMHSLLQDIPPKELLPAMVIYRGSEFLPISENVTAVPVEAIWS